MHFIEVVRVADSYCHVHAASIVSGGVDNGAGHDGRVWLDDLFIVGRSKDGHKNTDFFDDACLAASIDEVADFKRAE